MTTLRIAAYLRVSTHDQTIASQRHAIESYRQRQGWEADALVWYIDEGVSGSLPPRERPAFRRLLEACDRGEHTHIIAIRLDRMFRSARDLHEFLDAYVDPLKGRGVKLNFTQMDLGDLHSPIGKVLIGVLGLVAQLERDMLIERTREGLAAAVARGEILGRPRQWDQALNDPAVATAVCDYAAGTISLSEAARRSGIPRTSLRRILAHQDQPTPA